MKPEGHICQNYALGGNQIRWKSPLISQIVLADRLVGDFQWNASSLIPTVFVPIDQLSVNRTTLERSDLKYENIRLLFELNL